MSCIEKHISQHRINWSQTIKKEVKKLIDWASEKGLPAKFDRECTHKFEFCKYIGNKYDPNLYGYFFFFLLKNQQMHHRYLSMTFFYILIMIMM